MHFYALSNYIKKKNYFMISNSIKETKKKKHAHGHAPMRHIIIK